VSDITLLEKRLEELEAAVTATVDRALAIEDRLDAMRDELQRAATFVYRIKLCQDADKERWQTQTETLQAIRHDLDSIHRVIGKD